jgi:TPR repeat protein
LCFEPSAKAQTNLGVMYKKGQGVAQDDKQAVAWFRKAADQGLADAQRKLGLFYFLGKWVIQDNKQAQEWFIKAVLQGDARAMFSMGVIYPMNMKRLCLLLSNLLITNK